MRKLIRISKNILRPIRNIFVKKTFIFLEKYLGIHITRAHYYSPIPNIGELSNEIYTKEVECVGLDLSVDKQMQYLQNNLIQYKNEYTPPVNEGLSQVDAYILYAIIRKMKPKRLIEIGSGESTRISLSALDENKKEGKKCAFTAIEPYPKDYLRNIDNNSFNLLEKKVQVVDSNLLSKADILFIDSSHVSKIGSDVNYEILEIVPRLKVGALVHWHDIMIPINYSKGWIQSGNKFWNESYMVHAFMLHNKCFKVIWASKYMQLHSSDVLTSTFSYFNPEDQNQQLSSFWIERVA